MRNLYCIGLLLYFCLASTCMADNKDPIVFVHGIAGWGRDEMAGYLYWGGGIIGGNADIEAILRKNNFQAYTADVGPFSSNWDRAVELYYQIKGGCVDYGVEHSKRFHHSEKPNKKCYHKPIYPQWDENHKIHFIGHSQGGQTIRVLAGLLEQGWPEEQAKSIQIGELFTGGKHWIRSITTISTPHNGTTLANMQNIIPLFTNIVDAAKKLSASSSGQDNQKSLYDLKLEQWSLQRTEGELLGAYLMRVVSSSPKDFSFYDLTPKGAMELNRNTPISDNIYYFSFGTNATKFVGSRFLGIGMECPSEKMQPTLWISSLLISPCTGFSLLTKYQSWMPNDGVVNTASMIAPSDEPWIDYQAPSHPGIWQYMGTRTGWDHLHAIGMRLDEFYPHWNVTDFYLSHAHLLQTL